MFNIELNNTRQRVIAATLAILSAGVFYGPKLRASFIASLRPKGWNRVEETSPMDSTKKIQLYADAIGENKGRLVVQFDGKELDVYVVIPNVVDSENAPVRIRFEGTKPDSEIWSRATSYHGIFSPKPYELLSKLQNSSKFYIEYHPYESVPQTLVFDLKGLAAALPQDEMAATPADRLRERVEPYVRQCVNSDDSLTGEWCWTDPSEHTADSVYWMHQRGYSSTREEAISNAMEMARTGLAFKQ
jgi:hypothetical protein